MIDCRSWLLDSLRSVVRAWPDVEIFEAVFFEQVLCTAEILRALKAHSVFAGCISKGFRIDGLLAAVTCNRDAHDFTSSFFATNANKRSVAIWVL